MSDFVYQLGYDANHHQLLITIAPDVWAELRSPRQTKMWLSYFKHRLGPFAPASRGRWGYGRSFIPYRSVNGDSLTIACPIPRVFLKDRRPDYLALLRRLESLSVLFNVLNGISQQADDQLRLTLVPKAIGSRQWQVQGDFFPCYLGSLTKHLFDVSWVNIRQSIQSAEQRMLNGNPFDPFVAEYNPDHKFVLGYPRCAIEIDPDLTGETTSRSFVITGHDPIRVMALLAGLGHLAGTLRRRSLSKVA